MKLTKKKRKMLRIAGVLGISSPVIMLIAVALSIHHSPWFEWTDYWLSNLAGFNGDEQIWAANGLPSIIFNAGLMAAGILGMISVYIPEEEGLIKTTLGHIIDRLVFFSMFFLFAIGLFPITTGELHQFVAHSFFVLVSASLILTGFFIVIKVMGDTRHNKYHALSDILAISLFSFLVLLNVLSFRILDKKAVAEMIPITLLSVLLVSVGLFLIRLSMKPEKSVDEVQL